MAEEKHWGEKEFIDEAKRIVREYLSGLMWNKAQRDVAVREVRPSANREGLEEKFQEHDQREEEIEWKFGQDVDRWRKSTDPNRKIVLEYIVKQLGARRDLGFYGKRIVDRLKRETELR